MRQSFLLILYLFSFVQVSCAQGSAQTESPLVPESKHGKIATFVTRVLGNSHYRKQDLNDALSEKIYDNYLKRLDYNRSYFLQSDIEEFAPYRTQLDDLLEAGDMKIPFKMYNRMMQRLQERIAFVEGLLPNEFDYTKEDSFMVNREEAAWFTSKKQLDNYWHDKIKYECLSLKVAGKDAESYSETIEKRYARLKKQMNKTRSEDVFGFFMDSYAGVFDPHTTYFSPKQSEDFNINMSLSLEGIGATLQTDNDHTKIVSIVKGGPADKSGKLHANDKIVAVAQGKKGEFEDVVGWRIDDVVQLIRGPKGSVVRLKVINSDLPVTSPPEEIELVRDKIKLEEQAAKGEIQETIRDGKTYKLGVIKVPTFYLDFAGARRGDKDYKSTTRDVKRIIEDFESKGVDGLVLDLRNNGGGSLLEAINLSGLFISKGPVVQVKNTNGRVDIEKDKDPTVNYAGPMVVLVNRFSASASEILAAAMQDYGRALIVGERTFGKGTVQNLADLDRFLSMDNEKAGQLKLTIAKFYRITGSSTQLRGVRPDILFPSRYDGKEYGEASQDFALPWDEIDPASYTRVAHLSQLRLKARGLHDTRMQAEPEYNYLLEDIQELERNRKRKYVPLSEDALQKERKKSEERKAFRKAARLDFPAGEETPSNDEEEKKDVKAPDLILQEGKQILLDVMEIKE